MRDAHGFVLCCHGRPMTCEECAVEYEREIAPAPSGLDAPSAEPVDDSKGGRAETLGNPRDHAENIGDSASTSSEACSPASAERDGRVRICVRCIASYRQDGDERTIAQRIAAARQPAFPALSALRELVEQWREAAAFDAEHMGIGQSARALYQCADELDALLTQEPSR